MSASALRKDTETELGDHAMIPSCVPHYLPVHQFAPRLEWKDARAILRRNRFRSLGDEREELSKIAKQVVRAKGASGVRMRVNPYGSW